MDHYRNPRNREDPKGADVVRRGRNPRCGDDLEVGVDFDGERVKRVRFHGRGCSICIASASMMTEAVSGSTRLEVEKLYADLSLVFDSNADPVPSTPPGPLRALSAVKPYPARRRCVLLAWEALAEAIRVSKAR